MANHTNGDMLTEKPVCATSASGSPRVILVQWKETTAAQTEEIKKFNNYNLKKTANIE